MYRTRWLEKPLASGVSRNKVRLLFGARQVGKTALLREMLSGGSTRFFDLQDATTRRRLEADPSAFSREVRALPRSIRNVVVDEVQKVPALLDEIQSLYDTSRTARQLYLTGSSARQLRTRSSNLLPGRAHTWRLHPITSWEVESGAPLELSPPRARSAPDEGASQFPARNLSSMLRFGCLPGIWFESPGAAAATLSSYVGAYLEEEIRREALVREMGPFIVFLRLAGLESGRQTNLTKLSTESGIAASTLKNYYQTLVDTFVGHWLFAYARRSRKRLLTTPRFYFFDVGVRNAAADLPAEASLLKLQGGALLEHWVAQELIARAGYLGRGYGVSFWRTTTGAEVDFVWETPRSDLPIEVKWTERPRPSDARHLELFLDTFRDRAKRGLLVCRCAEPEQLTDRVRAIPYKHL